jgi:hypothetical protein
LLLLALRLTVVLALVVAGRSPASALPIFSHEYGVSCQKCHSAIPSLNDYGRAFLANGYHLPGVTPGSAIPISVKANLLDTSAPDPGLPKAVVDEIEVLTAGTIGSRTNYFVEQYAVDGGQHGNLREAWAGTFLTPLDASVPIYLRAGQFTLPLPVDPETFRESYNDYALFDQQVGANPFNFFDPKLGLSARFGHADRGVSVEVSALNGHDQQSGLPTVGVDTMETIHDVMGAFDLSAYRYSGRRGTFGDEFSRTGVGVRYESGRWTSETVLQENSDTNADGLGLAERSSGGFSQLRYEITRKLFALERIDGTNDLTNGFTRSATTLLGYRLSHNARVTIEDVLSHTPRTMHTLNTQLTIAY